MAVGESYSHVSTRNRQSKRVAVRRGISGSLDARRDLLRDNASFAAGATLSALLAFLTVETVRAYYF
jgi:hypothetical protein